MLKELREAAEHRVRAVLLGKLATALLRVAESEEQLAEALSLPPLLPPAGEAVAP
jgi:hypothetical protein